MSRTLNALLLPLSTTKGGNIGSAFALIAALLGSTPALAEDSLAGQVDHALQQHLSQRLAREAQQQSWQGMRFSLKSIALPADAPAQPCPRPLLVSDEDGAVSALSRQRLRVTCPGTSGWTLVLAAQAHVFVQALLSTRAVERGEVLSADMLERQEIKLGKQHRTLIASVDDAVGLSAKRRIRPHQVLSTDLLVSPWLVRRGDKVKVTARHGEIQAAVQGVALEDGRLGALIRVKNSGSGKTIDAQVTGAGEVSSTFGQ